MTLGFDAVGNRITRSDTSPAASTTLSYAGTSNRLQQVAQGTVLRSYTTNAVGDITAFTGTDGVANTLTYDPFGRLASHTKSGATTTYTVNALDQRINKTGPAVVGTRYLYGGQNWLLGERNASNWTSYLWNGNEPVAMVRGTQIYYLHTDHLGRPQLATNASRSVVWKANYTAFNRGVNVDSIGGLNLGNPGQYLDAESGLWHNGYRDYDSTTGRYLQSDPIGLDGGINTYVYASGNPVNLIDPLGLAEFELSAYCGVGAGVKVAYKNGTLEITGRFGVGLGGGISFDPKGGPSPHALSQGSGGIARMSVEGSLGLGVGPVSAGVSGTMAAGNAFVDYPRQTGGGIYNTTGSYLEGSATNVGVDNSWKFGVRAGGSLGVDIGSYSNWQSGDSGSGCSCGADN